MPLPLVTERLRLRPATIDDLEDWWKISRDAETAWFGRSTLSRNDARHALLRHIAHQERYGFALWPVELKETREVVGVTGLVHLADGPEVEVGYRFRAEQRGQGYATEAARAAVEFGFLELGLERIVAVTLPTNTASRNVMQKLGMTFVGVVHVYGHAQVKYALSR